MATPKVEWIRREEVKPYVRHARATPGVTLCGVSPGLDRPSMEGLRCNLCLELEKKLATPEGQLVFAVFGHLAVFPETWQLARYVVEQGSLLANELVELRNRVDALYRSPPTA